VNRLLTLKGSLESRIEAAIRLLKDYPEDEIEETIRELSAVWGITPRLSGRAFLSWEEARMMAQSNLITLGSHTASHRILTLLDDAEIKNELERSKQKLIAEEAVDPAFIPFCYPNGNYTTRIANMVEAAGYSLAVTTAKGWNHDGSDRFALKRVPIHQDMASTKGMFTYRIINAI
jgi:peptidoglycan/xylan/chitin deacetylase (PgdA/CDA1 family)